MQQVQNIEEKNCISRRVVIKYISSNIPTLQRKWNSETYIC